jgi:hypothetical protein
MDVTNTIRIPGLKASKERIDAMVTRIAKEEGVTEQEIRDRMRDTLRTLSGSRGSS